MVLIIITKMANAMMQMDEGIAPQKESPASAKGGLGGGALSKETPKVRRGVWGRQPPKGKMCLDCRKIFY